MVRQGAHAREIMVPRIEVSGLGNYVRNQGYVTGAIEFSYEAHSPDYDRGLKLVADVMDIEEAGVLCGAAGKGFIPCIAQGGPGSVYPGVYQSMWDEIDAYNTEKFGWTKEQLDEARLPISVMF